MSDHAAKVFNEKVKAVSLMVRNAALLIFAAAIAKWYGEGLGLVVAMWLTSGGLMTTFAIKMLTILEPED